MAKFNSQDLKKLIENGVLELHSPNAKVWRDCTRNALVVSTMNGSNPYDGSARYVYVGQIKDAKEMLSHASHLEA